METLLLQNTLKNSDKKPSYADRAVRLFAEAEDESFIIRESLYPFEPSFSEWIAEGWRSLSEELAAIAALDCEDSGWLHLAHHVREFRSKTRRLALPMMQRYYSSEEVMYMTGWTTISKN